MRFLHLLVFLAAYKVKLLIASDDNKQNQPNQVSKCIRIEYFGKPMNPNRTGIPCAENKVCTSRRKLNISYIEFPSYFCNFTQAYTPPIEGILLSCCGECVRSNFNIVNVFRNISELTPLLLNQSDFIFPFFGRASTAMLHGFYYLPLHDIPPAELITERKGADFIAFSRKVYPITVICVLVSILAGFGCWICETWGNPEEFSRTFLIGWFEGFWWSFVTMTTVGFGDKTPRSVIGRLYSVIWISVGVVSYGLLTGIVFSEVEKMNNPPPPVTDGKQIGALMYRDYDAYVVAKIGGKIVQNVDFQSRLFGSPSSNFREPVDFYEDAFQLIEKLRKKEISGVILDRYTLWHLKTISSVILKGKWKSDLFSIEDHIINVNYFFYNTMATQVTSDEDLGKLTYGILIKNRRDYDYLIDYATDNRFRERTNLLNLWNLNKKNLLSAVEGEGFSSSSDNWELYSDKTALLFSIEDDQKYFLTAVYSILIAIGIVFLIGIGFELRRTNFQLRKLFVRDEYDNHDRIDAVHDELAN